MISKNPTVVTNQTVKTVVSDPKTPYLKKSELPTNVSGFKNDVGYLTPTSLKKWLEDNQYVKLADVESIVESTNLEVNDTNYNTIKSHINNIKGEIDEIKAHLKDSIIEIISNGYISIDKASSFATKDDLKNLETKIGKIRTQDLSKFAKASDVYTKDTIDTKLEAFIEEEIVKNTYLPRKDIENIFITKKDANNKFLTIEDYRGLKAGAVISDSYKNNTINDIDKKLDSGVKFLDGFYIIDGGNSFVFIKNNEVISTAGGSGEGQMRWKVDNGEDYIKHT